jgi:hypothetical protein
MLRACRLQAIGEVYPSIGQEGIIQSNVYWASFAFALHAVFPAHGPVASA